MTKTLLHLLIWSLLSTLWSLTFAQTACTLQYDPVCGTNGVTYGNACTATAAGKAIDYAGTCKTGNEIDQALSMAYQFGITKYDNLTEFRSESLVTREQIAKMMLQFAKAMSRAGKQWSFTCSFTDLNTTDPTLTNYITDACKQGMIKWWDNAFHPQGNVSYAQAITMLMRVMNWSQTEPEQRWTPYEQYAITQWYLSQALGQPMWLITRGELIIWMNTIYAMDNQADTIYETRTIDDTLIPCTGEAEQECMQISRNGWDTERFYDQIAGFNYVPWYNYTLQVVWNKIDNPPADASNMNRSLVKLQSHSSTSGKPDTLPQAWCDWVKIDNDKLTVWWQTCITSNWSATVSYNADLPGVILSTKQAQITTQVPMIHLFIFPASTGLQSLLFSTHSAMIKQSLVDKSESCIFQQNTSVIWSRIDRFDFTPDTAITSNVDCGPYGYSSGSASYFVKPKDLYSTMIYINNNPAVRPYIDRSSLIIK